MALTLRRVCDHQNVRSTVAGVAGLCTKNPWWEALMVQPDDFWCRGKSAPWLRHDESRVGSSGPTLGACLAQMTTLNRLSPRSRRLEHASSMSPLRSSVTAQSGGYKSRFHNQMRAQCVETLAGTSGRAPFPLVPRLSCPSSSPCVNDVALFGCLLPSRPCSPLRRNRLPGPRRTTAGTLRAIVNNDELGGLSDRECAVHPKGTVPRCKDDG